MGIKLLWLGLTIIIALGFVLDAIGLHANTSVFSIIGAVIMIIGIVLFLLDK